MRNNVSFLRKPRFWFFLMIVSAVVVSSISFASANDKNFAQQENAKTNAQESVEKLKLAMLDSWEAQAQAQGLVYSIPKQFQGAVFKAGKLDKNKKVIALTFDDGPWNKNTDKILDILKQNNIKATFFMLGNSLKNFPAPGKRVVAEGHAIGNHTWHHYYHKMNQKVAGQEIETTADLIYKVTGIKTNIFRPPGGIMTNGVVDYAKKHNYTVIMWSDDSTDYSHLSVPGIINRVMKQAKPGGIVLMHDGGGSRLRTVAALPQIISKLKAQGYSFVTVPALLQMQADQK